MQIKIDLKIFVFIIIFVITRQIEIYGLLMFFAFLHELGHLFAGVALGFKPKSLSFNPLGLSINFRIGTSDYNRRLFKGNILALKRLIIAVSGPIVNFLLVIFFCILDKDLFNVNVEFLIYSNILIGIFNLIPIYPLDGGRIIKNILHIINGLENTYGYINLISKTSIVILTIFSSVMILYLKNISILFILGYLWYLVINENKVYCQRLKMYEIINNEADYNSKVNSIDDRLHDSIEEAIKIKCD